MAIVSSVISEDSVQLDLRRAVIEHHTDHLGGLHAVNYLAEAGADVAATMNARVAQIEAGLADTEVQRNIGNILSNNSGAITTQHVTVDVFSAAVRELFLEGSGEDIGRLATWLLTLSDARLRGVFNISQGEVAALRSRLQTRADVVANLDGLVGE